jgi:hypothetical protein
VAPVSRTFARVAAALLGVAAAALIAIPAALAAFTAPADNPGDTVTAAPDFRAPAIEAVALAKKAGSVSGFVKQGGAYFVYAKVAADTGNPASGIAGVKADASASTPGQAAVPLLAGSYAVGGASFNYRSEELTAAATLAEGARAFTVTTSDNAGNANLANGSATVDNTPPQASDIQTTSAGSNGLAEQNDAIVFSFSEPIDPESVLAGWTGGATAVTVRVSDGGLLGLPVGDDGFQVYNAANTATLPLGTVDLGRGDYAAGLLGGHYRFLSSTMAMSGSAITVTLGPFSQPGVLEAANRTAAAAAGTMVWTPVATPFDRAGNVISATAATESGAADKDF